MALGGAAGLGVTTGSRRREQEMKQELHIWQPQEQDQYIWKKQDVKQKQEQYLWRPSPSQKYDVALHTVWLEEGQEWPLELQ